MTSPAVEIRNLAKYFDSVVALKNVDLSIAAGEYFVLLGPSDGGKTTLLRSIGGFHKPTRGQILLHGKDVTDVPLDIHGFPRLRAVSAHVGTAQCRLWPHICRVTEGSGPREKRRHAGDGRPCRLRQPQAARAVRWTAKARSAGTRLILDRDILLLDEPLAALDAQLHKDMCLELKHLQEKVGITFIHVAHNQEEAMTVADHIAVVADGELVEVGAAQEIYRARRKRFTASFVGENNLLEGRVSSLDRDNILVSVGDRDLAVERNGQDVAVGDRVTLSVRSELVRMSASANTVDPAHSLSGIYTESVYLGLTTSLIVRLPNDVQMVSRVIADGGEQVPDSGAAVHLTWRPGSLRLHTN